MDSSLAITLDTLRAATHFVQSTGKPQQVQVKTVGAQPFITTGSGMRMQTDLSFNEAMALNIDWIIVPGLGLITDQAIVARFKEQDAIDAMALLQHLNRKGTKIAASCSAVFMLAECGLLDGKHATMTWWLAHVFRSRHPEVKLDESKMLVRDGNFLTAGSAYSQLDLILAITAETMGTAIAHLCSRYLLIDQRPSQARYMIQTHIQHNDPTVVEAERWIDEHLSAPIAVTTLSSHLAVSSKTLARRIEAATGLSPVKFIQRRRLMRAAHLIETTSMSVDAIAAQVGYQDGTALRKLVKREFGTTPGALR